MFKVTLHWWENDASPASSIRTSEEAAREYAAERSKDVQGYVEIHNQNGIRIALYKDGGDTMFPVQQELIAGQGVQANA